MAEEGGVGKNAAAVVEEDQQDMGDGTQCSDHPLKKNTGGICALCLQDKLGMLVASSSFDALPPTLAPSSSSSTSPPFRSDAASVYSGAFNPSSVAASSSSTAIAKTSAPPDFAALKRSKSTTSGPRRGSSVADAHQVLDKSPRRRRRRRRSGFWLFLYPSFSSSKQVACRRNVDNCLGGSKITSLTANTKSNCTVEVDNARNEAAVETDRRKVSRSRSVGCGSRSFSGDFFGRISNGFGDCTLRRVESQREAKANKPSAAAAAEGRHRSNDHHQYMKEKVRCGGIFGGFKVTSSSSSSSSSSHYHSHWVAPDETAAANNKEAAVDGRLVAVTLNGRSHYRNSWGWALASPMRVFSKPSSKNGKRLEASSSSKINGTVPDLGAIPSLLTASG